MKQNINAMIILTIGYNKIHYKSNTFNTDSFTTLHLTTLLHHNSNTFLNFFFKFLKFNYQLLWEQHDQNAYINFPQVLTETELLPNIINIEYKNLHY